MSSKVDTLYCTIDQVNPRMCRASISIPPSYIDTLYHQTALDQKNSTFTQGFMKGDTPLLYIKEHYKANFTTHLKEFLFRYCVLSFLYDTLQKKQVAVAGDPRLHSIIIEPEKQGLFVFELSLAAPIEFREWKGLPFKAPKRKNYKDIDRQVEQFIREEEQFFQNNASDTIQIGDWICFEISVVDHTKHALIGEYKEEVWLRIGQEEADIPFQELMFGKKEGDEFFSANSCLQEYFSQHLDTHYLFRVKILERIPVSHFSFEQFKHHFRLRTTKDVHLKLIEVFSFRNDISQRRMMAEEALKLLISKNPHVEVPHYEILRQQKKVLESVQHNPDYNVYKTEPNFKETIKQLALKQAREQLFTLQLAMHEKIDVTTEDIKGYLNLLKRQRTKEFIYFNPPSTKIQGQEMPLPSQILKRRCLLEKTLNHVIYHLMKK